MLISNIRIKNGKSHRFYFNFHYQEVSDFFGEKGLGAVAEMHSYLQGHGINLHMIYVGLMP